MNNFLTNLFVSEKMYLVFWVMIIYIILLALDNIRLRYIRKIKNRIIDNQCKDIYNALNGRADLVYKRMNKDVNTSMISCKACKYYKFEKYSLVCKKCKREGSFSHFVYRGKK